MNLGGHCVLRHLSGWYMDGHKHISRAGIGSPELRKKRCPLGHWRKWRRGQRGRVEAGKIPGGNSYGYRIIRQLLADGSVTTGEREINPEEAGIVTRIFKEYAEGMAPRQIAMRLNREGVPSPRGGQWNASTINGNRLRRNGILNNELYTGRITYNRQRFLKDPETGKRVARLNPEREWVTREVDVLSIIDEELWQQVQDIKRRYSSRWGNKRQTKKRLFSGLLKCGRCGGGMTTSRSDRYYCSARREKGMQTAVSLPWSWKSAC
jgi:site-specific DNA recombinase